jgi:hypothetical protein
VPSPGTGKWKAKSWPAGRLLQLTQLNDVLSIALPVDRESADRIVALTRR